jgi:hypothetical protein
MVAFKPMKFASVGIVTKYLVQSFNSECTMPRRYLLLQVDRPVLRAI